MTRQVKILVSGRVQGVCFRAFTQKQANKLGITGSARNLPGGQVEVLAFGASEAVEKLIEWCHKGPTTAKVDCVVIETVNVSDIPVEFEIR